MILIHCTEIYSKMASSLSEYILSLKRDELRDLEDMIRVRIKNMDMEDVMRKIQMDVESNGYHLLSPNNYDMLSIVRNNPKLFVSEYYVNADIYSNIAKMNIRNELKSKPQDITDTMLIVSHFDCQSDWIKIFYENIQPITTIFGAYKDQPPFDITSEWEYPGDDWDDNLPASATGRFKVNIIYSLTVANSPKQHDSKLHILDKDGNGNEWKIINNNIYHKDQLITEINQYHELGIIKNYKGLNVDLISVR